jgi:hypothetical protein
MSIALTRPTAKLGLAILICAAGLLGPIALNAVQGSGVGEFGRAGMAHGQLVRAYGALPLGFQPNRGQADRRVDFLSSGAGYGLFLTPHRVVLALAPPGGDLGERGPSSHPPAVLSMGLLGARPDPRIYGGGRLPGRVNYLRGADRTRWSTDIPTFSSVRYAGVWPGIGMRFYGNQHRLEYDFDLSPGVGAGAIRLRFGGQRHLRLDSAGNLLLGLGGRTVRQLRPRAYQLSGGERQPVASRYVLLHGGVRVGVKVGAHDPRRALTIDPQLVYSSYLGGAFKYGDSANAIAVDGAGDAYVTGSSYYSNFPITPGAFETKSHPRGPWDTEAFVTEFNPSGSGLVYSTYLGNGNESSGDGIAVDSAGNAYVAGYTTSSAFPTTAGAFRATGSGAFVTKLNPAGSGLVYSTLLGESRGVSAIAVDAAGNAYVTGSSADDVPTTPGAFQATGHGAFVTKLNPSGSALVYSTYLGAIKYAGGSDIAVDQSGNAYVAGSADSAGFPTTAGAFRATGSGAFVAKLNPAGSGLVYSTLLGEKSGAYAIAVDSAGDAYVTGRASTATGFPTTAGAFQANGRGAFVTKLNPSGSGLVYSTMLGSTGTSPSGIAVDPDGNAYVGGTTSATNFPTTTGALQRSAVGYPHNLFVTKLNPAGSGLLYSTYLGGGSDDSGLDMALGAAGHVYVTGHTSSTDFPSTPGAFQRRNHTNEGYAAFVAELDPSGPPVPGISLGAAKRGTDRVVLRGHLDPAAEGSLSGSARWHGHGVALSLRRRKGQLVLKTARLRGRGLLKLTVAFQGSQSWESESLQREVRFPGRSSGSR